VGGLIAGMYGVMHDQVTYGISPEYFTRLKFAQFWYADVGLGNRWFAGIIGFLATSWVGFAAAWFLARRLVPGQSRAGAYRQLSPACALVLVAALVFALLGNAYGGWMGLQVGSQVEESSWSNLLRRLSVSDRAAFVRVAYIHYGGYVGGLAGLIGALVWLRPVAAPQNQGDEEPGPFFSK
jgi:hypothetical protein